MRQIGAGRSHPLLLPLLQANANTTNLTVDKAPASTPKAKAVTRSPSPDVLHRRGQCTASLTQFSSPCFDHQALLALTLLFLLRVAGEVQIKEDRDAATSVICALPQIAGDRHDGLLPPDVLWPGPCSRPADERSRGQGLAAGRQGLGVLRGAGRYVAASSLARPSRAPCSSGRPPTLRTLPRAQRRVRFAGHCAGLRGRHAARPASLH